MDNRPIGVFDSGLGGLTAVKELEQALPNESIVYFGDTGRVPYGTRSRETVRAYAKQDMDFLMSQNVKAVLAACGTVSSTAQDIGAALLRPRGPDGQQRQNEKQAQHTLEHNQSPFHRNHTVV